MKEQPSISLVGLAGDILAEAPAAARRYLIGRAFLAARSLAARLALDLRPLAEAEQTRAELAETVEACRSTRALLEMERARAEFAETKLNTVTSFLSPNKQPERRA